MNKKNIVTNILEKKAVRDYSYAILFFLISSFFLLFAIRPALVIAFSLRREAHDLRKLNEVYESNILKLVDIQSQLELVRDQIYLLETALPNNPNSPEIIQDIQTAAQVHGVSIRILESSKINLKNTSKAKIKMLPITAQVSGDFNQVHNFLLQLQQSKRLKTVEKLQIVRDEKEATTSSQLKVIIDVNSYYL